MQSDDVLTLYMSPDGNDSWSGKYAEPRANKMDGPLATINGVFKQLFHGNISGLGGLLSKGAWKKRVSVQMRGGVYRIKKPIVITPVCSWNISFIPFKQEVPIIDGGVALTGWKETTINKTKVWITDAPCSNGETIFFNQLFVNDRRAHRPKLYWENRKKIGPIPGVTPLEGWGWGQPGNSFFKIPAKEFVARKNIVDVEVVCLHYWIEERLPVVSYDSSSGMVTSSRVSCAPLADADYYLDNVFEAFGKKKGEWYLDRSAKKVYYYPLVGETMKTSSITIPKVYQFLRLIGNPDENRFVENISFSGITFRHSACEYPDTPHVEESMLHTGRGNKAAAFQAAWDVPGVILMKGARNCSVEDCRIEHIGWYGIELEAGCSNNRIVGNTICDMGAGGIKINGSASPLGQVRKENNILPENRTYDNRCTDNTIYDGGHVFHSAIGILLRHASGNVLAHNLIHHLYYTGISLGWSWSYGESATHDNVVEKNHIHTIGQGLLSDMGGIYTLGVQPGTVLRGNLIHDIKKRTYGGWAIYNDEGSSHIVVENNICYDTNASTYNQHYGRENVVRNNIFAFSDEALITISRNDGHSGATIYRNIVITNNIPIYLAGYDYKSVEQLPADCFSNLFWNVSGKNLYCTGPAQGVYKGKDKIPAWRTLEKWQKLGFDRHSIVADPQCTDINKRDFRVGKNSPACKVFGFKPIDMSDVGPRNLR